MYYIGRSGVIKIGHLTVGGISGIYYAPDFTTPLPNPVYFPRDLKTLFRTRLEDMEKLRNVDGIDIMLSHDWPTGIWDYGDTEALLKKKPFLRNSIESYQVGNPHSLELLASLKP